MIIAKRPYPIPSRTRKSSSFASMVLHGRLCGRVDRHRLFLFLCLAGAPTASAALLMWWERTGGGPHAHSSLLPCICIQPSTKKYFCFVLIPRNMRHFVRLLRQLSYSCGGNVRGGRSPRTFELASLYLHPAKHKKVSSLCIDTHKINLVRICSE